jgi:hypothetical protein
MNDRILNLTLTDELLRRLAAAAEAANLSVEVFATRLVEAALAVDGMADDSAAFRDAHDWTDADRRLADYDLTGDYIDAETVLDAFVAAVDAGAAARR